MRDTNLRTLWTPPDRTPAQLMNARIRIAGSVILIVAMLVGLAVLALR